MHETRRQFLTFSAIGLLNTAIDAAIFFASVSIFGLTLLLSNILAWLGAVQFSYFMNSRITFRKQHESEGANDNITAFLRYQRFILSNLTGLVVSTVTLLIAETMMLIVWAKLCAIVAGLCVNFVLSKFYVFRSSMQSSK